MAAALERVLIQILHNRIAFGALNQRGAIGLVEAGGAFLLAEIQPVRLTGTANTAGFAGHNLHQVKILCSVLNVGQELFCVHEAMSGWIKNPVIGDGDNVDTVTVGGVTVRGTEMRTIFSLRSASFETEVQGDKIVFFVTGFGHGVGMSQYGANEMAKEGNTWKDIITHYYTGVTVAAYMPDEEA